MCWCDCEVGRTLSDQEGYGDENATKQIRCFYAELWDVFVDQVYLQPVLYRFTIRLDSCGSS